MERCKDGKTENVLFVKDLFSQSYFDKWKS